MEAVDLGPVTLQGPRVRMREVGPDDASAAMQWAGDADVFQFMVYEVVTTLEEEAAFLAGIEARAAERPRPEYDLGIELDGRGLIGMARLGITSFEHHHAELGYCLRRDEWGRGYATEAAGLLLELAFTRLGLHRVRAFHDPRNVASSRVLEKLGMQREGVLRENFWTKGRWRDSVVWAVLEPEWRARTISASRAP